MRGQEVGDGEGDGVAVVDAGDKVELFWDMVTATRGKYSSSKLDSKAECIVPWCRDWGLTTTLVC